MLSSHVMVGLITFIPNDLQEHLITITSSIPFFKLVNYALKVEVRHDDFLFANQFDSLLPSDVVKPVIELPVTLSYPWLECTKSVISTSHTNSSDNFQSMSSLNSQCLLQKLVLIVSISLTWVGSVESTTNSLLGCFLRNPNILITTHP